MTSQHSLFFFFICLYGIVIYEKILQVDLDFRFEFADDVISWLFLYFSQTWANDRLRITTTCLQRPQI